MTDKAKNVRYESDNRAAAEVILADVAKCGEGSGLVEWARLFVANHPISQKSPDLGKVGKLATVVKKPHLEQRRLFSEAA